MLFHNFDQDSTDPHKLVWSEVYRQSDDFLFHADNPPMVTTWASTPTLPKVSPSKSTAPSRRRSSTRSTTSASRCSTSPPPAWASSTASASPERTAGTLAVRAASGRLTNPNADSLVPTRPATVCLHWGTATMTTPEDRIAALGLQLPDPIKLPGDEVPFSFINVRATAP